MSYLGKKCCHLFAFNFFSSILNMIKLVLKAKELESVELGIELRLLHTPWILCANAHS